VLRKTLRILTLGIVAGYLIACLWLYLNQEQMLFHPTVLAHDFVYPFTHHATEGIVASLGRRETAAGSRANTSSRCV